MNDRHNRISELAQMLRSAADWAEELERLTRQADATVEDFDRLLQGVERLDKLMGAFQQQRPERVN